MAVHSKVQGLSTVNCATTAEPTDMQFGMLSWVDPVNHVLDGSRCPSGKGHFWGVWPIKKHCKAHDFGGCIKE